MKHLQPICTSCHRAKTKTDLKRRAGCGESRKSGSKRGGWGNGLTTRALSLPNCYRYLPPEIKKCHWQPVAGDDLSVVEDEDAGLAPFSSTLHVGRELLLDKPGNSLLLCRQIASRTGIEHTASDGDSARNDL